MQVSQTATRWRRVRLFLLGLLLLILLAGAGFVIWALWVPAPMPEAIAALQSDAQVAVTTDEWLVFQPLNGAPTTGFIFYPGGRVDARAYAPAAHAIAAAGHLVVIVPMPLNLAVLGVDRAEQVVAAYPQIKRWAIGGHSLGGAMAATYVYNHADQMAALIFWAAYPAANNSLAERQDMVVTSIYGTRDGLATLEKVDASRALLPATTVWVSIEGGNHAQFGWYGPQGGDNEATITRSEQQQQVIEATLAALNE